MSEATKTPWHLWTVAILTLLWNGSGAYVILMAQRGLLPNLTPDEIAYYAAQPLWFQLTTDVALFAPIAGAIALLLRSKHAAWLFWVSTVTVCAQNLYDLVAGSSRALANTGAMVATSLIVILAILQLVYTLAQRKRRRLN